MIGATPFRQIFVVRKARDGRTGRGNAAAGTSQCGRNIHRRAAACRHGAGPRVARRLPLRHERHQGGGRQCVGAREGPRLSALRLFGPWRIRRRIPRRHDLEMARRKPGRFQAFHDRRPDPGRLVHGRVDCAAHGGGIAQGRPACRRSGAAGAGAGFHSGADRACPHADPETRAGKVRIFRGSSPIIPPNPMSTRARCSRTDARIAS